jgi:hypothetical protein
VTIFKLTAAAVAITAALLTQPVFGAISPVHQFVLTENSSTSLAVTYDGSPLTVLQPPGFPDEWNFALPTGFLATVGLQQWTEPENSNLVNAVSFGTAMTRAGIVQSDFSLNTQFPINADGASVLVGTDGGVDVFASFTDNAVTSEATVPDTGTTYSLFGLSLMGLAFLRRKLC